MKPRGSTVRLTNAIILEEELESRSAVLTLWVVITGVGYDVELFGCWMTQNGGHSLLAANDSQPESPVCIALLGFTRGSPKYSVIRQNNPIIFLLFFIII